MDTRNEIREFLTSRRAKLKAADVGLPDHGTRRVLGLRREEVAVLAGVSAPYYARLERGDTSGASEGVLEAAGRRRRPTLSQAPGCEKRVRSGHAVRCGARVEADEPEELAVRGDDRDTREPRPLDEGRHVGARVLRSHRGHA